MNQINSSWISIKEKGNFIEWKTNQQLEPYFWPKIVNPEQVSNMFAASRLKFDILNNYEFFETSIVCGNDTTKRAAIELSQKKKLGIA